MANRRNSIIIPHQQYDVQPQQPTLLPNQRAFERWMYRNNFNHQTPIQIQNSFRNLQDPLSFIRDTSIKKLQRQSQKMKENMRFQKQTIAQMSKSTYKKVISRDQIDYQFGRKNLNNQIGWLRNSYHDYQKRQEKKKDDNTKILQKRQELMKTFIHNQHQFDIVQKNQKKPLTLPIIKQIDNKDYQEKYKDLDLYQVFLRTNEEKHISAFSDISQNYEMDQLLSKIRFNLIDRDSHYSIRSRQYLFKPEQQLDFWRKYSNEAQQQNPIDEIQIMKRCHNFNPKQPSYMHLLDYASNKLDSQVLALYFQLKSKQQAEIKINQNDENLEEEYNKKKQQYDFLREMKMRDKTQRIAIKYTKNTAQTIDNLEDQSFDSYFEEVAKNLLIRLRELNNVRDSVMEKKQNQNTKKVMLINIGHQIKNILFKLLALTLEGESFVSYEELMAIPEQAEAQKKILQILYHDFHRIKNPDVDGIPKTTILDIYLQERQKNQKMFELLGRVYAPEKQTTQKKSRTPVKTNVRNAKPTKK